MHGERTPIAAHHGDVTPAFAPRGRVVLSCPEDDATPFHEHLRDQRCDAPLCDPTRPIPFDKHLERVNREDRFERSAADRLPRDGRPIVLVRPAPGYGAANPGASAKPAGLHLGGVWPVEPDPGTRKLQAAYRPDRPQARGITLDLLA